MDTTEETHVAGVSTTDVTNSDQPLADDATTINTADTGVAPANSPTDTASDTPVETTTIAETDMKQQLMQ